MTSGNGSASPSFTIRIASTGEALEVPSHKSVLYVLVENGYRVRSSCSDGRCGTCKTRYIEGEPDHRDSVLGAEERTHYLTVCVSRSHSSEIVLDLPPPGTSQSLQQAIDAGRSVAFVQQPVCVACLNCVRACTFGAVRIDASAAGVGGIMGAAVIDAGACTGCGLCAAVCPTRAIGMTQYTDAELDSILDEALHPVVGDPPEPNRVSAERSEAPRIVAFCCPNCVPAAAAFPSHDDARRPVELDVVDMPCTGRVDNLHIMKAFEAGADGVMVSGCERGCCHFSVGNSNAAKRVRWIRDWLAQVGLDGRRARMLYLPANGAARFAEATIAFSDELRRLGVNPVRANKARPAVADTPGMLPR